MTRRDLAYLMIGGFVVLVFAVALLAWGLGWRMSSLDAISIAVIVGLAAIAAMGFAWSELRSR